MDNVTPKLRSITGVARALIATVGVLLVSGGLPLKVGAWHLILMIRQRVLLLLVLLLEPNLLRLLLLELHVVLVLCS